MFEREDDVERQREDDDPEPPAPEPLEAEVAQPNSLLATQLSEPGAVEEAGPPAAAPDLAP